MITADIWMFVFSATVAGSTFVYAILTWRLVRETKRIRLAQIEPMVSVTYHPREEWNSFIDFRIKNIGAGPALDIKLDVAPDFEYMPDKWLSKLNLFQKGIKFQSWMNTRRNRNRWPSVSSKTSF